LLQVLAKVAAEVELASLEVRAEDGSAVLSWNDGRADDRRVVAAMSYPVGSDALARARLDVAVVSDFEDDRMAPQTEILLQVLADVLAANLSRLGSELAPRGVIAEGDEPAPRPPDDAPRGKPAERDDDSQDEIEPELPLKLH
jgi:hypothetical protein